ncbi:transcriptional repressor LexA [Dactylosporangium sp. NPDC050688]|uniref:transcriptional repressor LexA n=1 Tax=Dactylosporangium sp. NPDC050688 TaxID=3157217 RepID=UPI0033C75D7C
MDPDDGGEQAPAQLTLQQQRVLDAICASIQRRGYPPTVREIAANVRLSSPSSVAHHLKTLEQLGIIRRDPRNPRAIEVLACGHDDAIGHATEHAMDRGGRYGVTVPVLGAIAAGAPILAVEQVEEELILPAEIAGHGRVFGLRIRGDSMIEAQICDGDLVVIRQQPTADNGDIIAAMIDGEATVKQLRSYGGTVELVPRNPAYSVIPGNDAVILGKVVSVLRRL